MISRSRSHPGNGVAPALSSPLALVIAGGIILGLALGARHVQGLFLLPMTLERGWSRETFALAMAVQNLVWGAAQPFAGMIADRFGAARVMAAGLLLYGVGLYAMTQAATGTAFLWSAGICIGLALAGTTFGVVYAALSRRVGPELRGWALGLAGSLGGLGQFVLVPVAQAGIDGLGWPGTLWLLAGAAALVVPLAWLLRERASHTTPQDAGALSMGAAIREAFGHRGFWLLNIGFLACGFQLAFIAAHLPAYLVDRGLPARDAVIALAVIALANVAGTYACGQLGNHMRRQRLLAFIYLLRAAAIALFLLLPLQPWSVYLFAGIMGFIWLGTVPLTSGLVSQIFGTRYVATLFGFVFLGHQIGSFLGVWMGGYLFDRTGSYELVWLAAIGVGLGAALLHWPIDDRPLVRPPSGLATGAA